MIFFTPLSAIKVLSSPHDGLMLSLLLLLLCKSLLGIFFQYAGIYTYVQASTQIHTHTHECLLMAICRRMTVQVMYKEEKQLVHTQTHTQNDDFMHFTRWK